MKKDLELVKFNLTPSMSLELIKFNDLKKELNKLKELYNLDKNEKLLLKIKELEKKLINCRNTFIREFRLNNQEEIIKYLQIKDRI
jgi:hypothetical protein